MNTSWLDIKEYLLEILAKPTSEWDNRLAQIEDPNLRREVESYLYQDLAEVTVLERDLGILPVLATGAIDEQIGPYRLIDKLGQGGMGVVYLGLRNDDQPDRWVAIKVLSENTIDADSQRLFRREIEALSQLNHPHIAQLYDSGNTRSGRPYFIMERVEGIPIDRYCARHRLRLEERIRLIRKVCLAVHEAHRQLIVHRDLKPSNILVGLDGEPKLLDFGIAKLLQYEGLATVTSEDRRRFTPEYASPEQFLGQPIGTASDTYSLGVLLHRLLTGISPYRPAPIDDLGSWRRRVCEEEPNRPSSAVAETTAQEFGCSAKHLSRRLRGDLDAIVAMALRKEPNARYGTAEKLAEDLKLFLDQRPVNARNGTWRYRCQRSLRRHRTEWIATSLLLLVSLFQIREILYHRDLAQQQATRAEQEAETSDRVTEFLVEIFAVSSPSETRGNSVTARELLDKGANRIQEELRNEPKTRARLMYTMGMAYRQLGLYDSAIPLLDGALDLRQSVPGTLPSAIASILHEKGRVHYLKGELEEADDNLRQALRKLGVEPNQKSFDISRQEVLSILGDLALVFKSQGALENAMDLERQVLRGSEKLLGPEHPDTLSSLNNLAITLMEASDFMAARDLQRQVLQIRERTLPVDHPATLVARGNLAVTCYRLGEYERAAELQESVIAGRERVLGIDHPDTLAARSVLIAILRAQGSEAELIMQQEQLLVATSKHLGADHPQTLTAHNNLAVILLGAGRLAEAEQQFREVANRAPEIWGEVHPRTLTSRGNLAMILFKRGDPRAAAQLQEEVLAISFETLGPKHSITLTSMSNLGESLRLLSEFERAANLQQQAYEGRHEIFGTRHPDTTVAAWRLMQIQEQLDMDVDKELRQTVCWLVESKVDSLSKTLRKLRLDVLPTCQSLPHS